MDHKTIVCPTPEIAIEKLSKTKFEINDILDGFLNNKTKPITYGKYLSEVKERGVITGFTDEGELVAWYNGQNFENLLFDLSLCYPNYYMEQKIKEAGDNCMDGELLIANLIVHTYSTCNLIKTVTEKMNSQMKDTPNG